MSTEAIFRRQVLRAAARIREHLAGAGGICPLPDLYEHEWTELSQNIRRYDFARERAWKSAAESLISDIDYCAMRMRRRLDDFKSRLPRKATMEIASAAEIASDLFSVKTEFEELELDLQQKAIRVLTLPIELEGVYLGPFRIVLSWEQIGRGPCYDILAVEPHSAADNSDVTHPHVSGETLCEGEGATSIRSALAQGRLLDFFTLVKQILETYNGGSAYVALSRWSGGAECHDCGAYMAEDESWTCVRCYDTICSDCQNSCEGCEETLCSACSGCCAVCDSTFCSRCLTSHPKTQLRVCNSCLEQGEPTDDEEPAETAPGESSADTRFSAASPAADALCLAEAAVPA